MLLSSLSLTDMEDSVSIRRSGRRRIRPLKYWEFEMEDDFMAHADISYNISQLTRSCILDTQNATILSRTKAARHNSRHPVATGRETAKDSQVSKRGRKESDTGDKPGGIRNKKAQDNSTGSISTGKEQKSMEENEREKEDPTKRTETNEQSGRSLSKIHKIQVQYILTFSTATPCYNNEMC